MFTISPRSLTAAELAAENPVLPRGTIQFESDARRAKIGDGVRSWLNLDYFGAGDGGGGGVEGLNGVTGIWQGTETEYNAIVSPSPNVVYFVVPD